MNNDNNTAGITFLQLDADNFRACVEVNGKRVTVATIEIIAGDDFGIADYRVTYYRTPSQNPRNPAKTTRNVRATYDTVQARIIARGW